MVALLWAMFDARCGVRLRRVALPIWAVALVTLTLLEAGAAAQGVVPLGPKPQSKASIDIYGGTRAIESASLWQVALVYRALPHVDGLFCGGTHIGNGWVLTAAHCFFNEKTCARAVDLIDFYVAHGSVNLGSRVVLDSPTEVVLSPDWDCATRRGDAALVKVGRLSGTSSIALPTSAQSDQRLRPGQAALISGWGLTPAGMFSIELLEAPINVVAQTTCTATYGAQLPVRSVCAGDGVHDACTGDSGGPLFVRDGGKALQLGIVSFGKGCGKHPGAYTRVADQAAWIAKAITSKPCTPAQIASRTC
jgi:secreted trypsin-like serine protease